MQYIWVLGYNIGQNKDFFQENVTLDSEIWHVSLFSDMFTSKDESPTWKLSANLMLGAV